MRSHVKFMRWGALYSVQVSLSCVCACACARTPVLPASLLLLRLCDLRGASFCSSLLLRAASLPDQQLQRLLTRELTRTLPLLHRTADGSGALNTTTLRGGGKSSSSSTSTSSGASDLLDTVLQFQGIVRDLVNTSYHMAVNVADAVEVGGWPWPPCHTIHVHVRARVCVSVCA